MKRLLLLWVLVGLVGCKTTPSTPPVKDLTPPKRTYPGPFPREPKYQVARTNGILWIWRIDGPEAGL